MSICLRATGIDATRELAAAVSANLRKHDVVLLDGELGTGKTAFTQFLAEALGVDEPVTSPTFAIMNQYTCSLGTLAHLDAYRLGNSDGIDQLGLFELIDDGAVAVIEWGSLVADAFDEFLHIGFMWISETEREITLSANSTEWSTRVDTIAASSGLSRC
jgi:tRNA threonylcarbamoyladenosine biosynthesis protein TsaE